MGGSGQKKIKLAAPFFLYGIFPNIKPTRSEHVMFMLTIVIGTNNHGAAALLHSLYGFPLIYYSVTTN